MAFTIDFLLQRLEEQGLFNIILPLLLVFAIVYGILGKIGLFENDKINAIIAFVMGMYVTVFSEFALFLINITAGGMTVLVGLLFFLMIVGFGSSLSGGSPTSVLSDHKDAMTIVLMLLGGIIFVNSGGLLILGGYAVRIGLADVFQLTGLYVAFVVVKSLLGLGTTSHDKVRKLMEHYNGLVKQYTPLEGKEDTQSRRKKDDLQRDMDRLEKKMHKMGLTNKELNDLHNAAYTSFDHISDQFAMGGIYGRFGPQHNRRRLY